METMQSIVQEALKLAGVLALVVSVLVGAYVKRGGKSDVIERTEFNHTIASVRQEITATRIELSGTVERGNDRTHVRLDEIMLALTNKRT